ncbi:MAG: cyclic nucleotide-binding domain-containing protein, partial [Terriglobales bacterium]
MPAIERLAEAGQSMFVPRASVIFTPGDTAEGAYVIMSGRVRLAIAPDNRAPVWSRTLVPGSVFGLAAAINGNTQILSATAEEDSVLIFVERSALIAAMRE